MSRFVAVTPLPPPDAPFAATEGEEKPPKKSASNPAERIVKYMPVEIVSGYLFVMGIVQAAPEGNLRVFAAWLVFAAGLIVTPIFLIKYHKPKPEQMPQVWVATVAFPLWAYALGGPFAMPPIGKYYVAWFGGVLVGLYTWLVGLFYEPEATQHS
jgi:hypothetical protein